MAVTQLTGINIKDASVGIVDLSATGTPSSSTFLRGDNTWSTPTAAGTITVQDEGITQSTTVTTLNFVGAGVTATGAGAVETITIPGGGGNSGQATINFGASSTEDYNTTVTVNNAAITTGSYIRVSPYAAATADHDSDDYAVEGITAYATNIVNGVSFDIVASAVNGTWGRYLINYAF